MSESLFTKLAKSVIDGDDTQSTYLAEQLLQDDIPAKHIIDDGLMAGMEVVGNRFRENEIFVPEVLVSARAMKKAMDVLKPHLMGTDKKMSGVVMLGTVQGDIHDIGKNLVGILLQGAGYEIIDLGVGVVTETFLNKIEEHEPDILGLSAMLTTTMPGMEPVISEIHSANLPVKTIIGGAPVNESYARDIGADAYGKNASDGVSRVQELMEVGKEETI